MVVMWAAVKVGMWGLKMVDQLGEMMAAWMAGRTVELMEIHLEVKLGPNWAAMTALKRVESLVVKRAVWMVAWLEL